MTGLINRCTAAAEPVGIMTAIFRAASPPMTRPLEKPPTRKKIGIT